MTIRTDRVAGEVQKVVSEMLIRGEIKDPRLGPLVSITDVEVSRDLHYATLYVSVMQGECDVAVEALNHASGFIRRALGRRLRARHTPRLRFSKDTGVEYGSHMDKVLASLNIQPEEIESEEGEDTDS
ncbi:MAG: 30S ribosome-binding factor RbfA [Magnetococcales bacterium]|nr:30S ribosome-binding factor RbfA [Magnetococcales bacterium]